MNEYYCPACGWHLELLTDNAAYRKGRSAAFRLAREAVVVAPKVCSQNADGNMEWFVKLDDAIAAIDEAEKGK